jgi:APA family basic amino acid/polyamine antiporter
MADDGCAPAFLRTPPDSSATPPRAAILLQTALALTLLWTASFDAVLTWTGITLACSTTLTVYGLIRSRGASPAAVGFVVLSLLMLILSIRHRPTEAAWGLTTLAVGWLLRRSLQTRLK